MLNITSNSGIMTGFKKIGSENWENLNNLSILVKTTLSIRKYLVIIAFLTVGVYAFVLLNNQGVDGFEIFIFLTAILLIVWPEANMLILRDAVRLRGEFLMVQKAFLLNQIIRVVLILSLFFFLKNFISIKIVLAITILATWISYKYLNSETLKILNYSNSEVQSGYRKILLKYVKLNWHNSMFYAFKEQISIFFLGLFGSSNTLANLGALSRFSLLFLGVTAIVNNIIGPSFGRAKTKPELFKIIWNTGLLLSLVSVITMTVGYFFADEMLWLLGDEYAGLGYELILILMLSLLNLTAASVISLNNSRGWIRFSPKFEIPVNLISILIGAFIFDISTVSGTVYLAILASTATLILYIANLVYGLGYSHKLNQFGQN